MHQGTFTSEFVREYLRYIQRRRSTVTGLFYCTPEQPIIWGTVVEYGEPPRGGLLVEMGPESEPDNSCDYRFWHASQDESGKFRRKKVIMRDELDDKASN